MCPTSGVVGASSVLFFPHQGQLILGCVQVFAPHFVVYLTPGMIPANNTEKQLMDLMANY